MGLCLLLLNGTAAILLLPHAPGQLFAGWFETLRSSGPDRAFEIGNQSMLAMMGRLLRHDGFGLNVAALDHAAVFGITALLQLAIFAVIFWNHRAAAAPQEPLD